jgi:3-oxoacyl-[acyl-carrier-protein] synthase II
VKPPEHEFGFDPAKRIDHKIQRQVDPFIIYGLDAAGQALGGCRSHRHERGAALPRRRLDRLGIGGLPGIEKESLVSTKGAAPRSRRTFVHGRLINLISGQVSIKYGLDGPQPRSRAPPARPGAPSIGGRCPA